MPEREEASLQPQPGGEEYKGKANTNPSAYLRGA